MSDSGRSDREWALAGEVPSSLESALSGRYRLRREIGHGGMATVYLADDLKHERRVALKVLRPELATAVGPERFLREIGVTARLDHPHIVPLLDSGEAGGHLYYVMPFVEGESLRDRLRRETQLPLEDALRVTIEAADALSYAHRLGIVHRDVKPENILLSAGHARVVDFGIARAVTAAGGEGMTQTGVSVGTPTYMSPEQASGEEVDARADVYALGAVAYEMLAGEPPYVGPTSAALLAKKSLGPVPSVRTVRDTVPASVDMALRRALARLPADRFRSCAAFAEALHRSDFATDAGAALPRRRLAYGGLGALALIAGLLLVQQWQGVRAGGQFPTGAGGGPLEPTPDRIAVFPFAVQAGPELDWLGEALMDLVSEAVDGLGDLRRVDPFTIMSRLRREGDAANVEPETARQLAGSLGAGRYVLGTLMELEGELRITATLYDLGEGPDPAATASVRGRREELSGLVEELVRSVLVEVPLGGGARLGQVAALQTANYEAFRAYLMGEALLRRGAFDSAGVALRQAVDADSTFALAWYRLSLVQGWAAGSPYESIERAMELRERLAPRDRMLVEVQHAIRVGNGAEAERLGRRIVGSYPDHVEGWVTLAEVRRAYRWQLGIPIEEVASAQERALELDPEYPWAVVAAWRMAMLQRRHTDAAALLPLFPGGGGAGPLRTASRATLAFMLGDDEARRAVTREIEIATDWTVWNTGYQLATFTDSLAAARRFWLSLRDGPNRAENLRALAAVDLARLEVARGRFGTATAEYGRARSMTPTLAWADHAWRVSLPFFRRPRVELEALRDSLQGWEVPPAESVVNLHATARIPGELLPWVKEYVLGLLSARLGEHDVALGYARTLEDATTPRDTVGLRTDLALEIRALIALEEGRPEDALLLLEQCRMAIAKGDDDSVRLKRRPLARFLRANALALLGRDDEALNWYQTFEGEGWPTEYALLAPVYLRQAEIFERRGETADALQRYTWFLARWNDADPEYAPLIQDVRNRVERLSALRP